MSVIEEFKDIRPYHDDEVSEVMKRIVWEKGFIAFMKSISPKIPLKELITSLLEIKSVGEFQRKFIYPMVQQVIKTSISELSTENLNLVEKDKPYIFMSNHRDIILDSALLQYILVSNNYPTTEIAIGSNLLIHRWIVDLVRLNRSFMVKRDVPKIELYKYSVKLSKYIRLLLTEQKHSVWLAQREGRTKDGNDSTQIGVLKMLNLSGEQSLVENIKALNIIPLAISYEFEPCIMSKVQSLYNQKINPSYKKSKLDDLSNMQGGLEVHKGQVHYSFGEPINSKLHILENVKNRKQQFDLLKQIIDNEIIKNYKFSLNNYIAADIYSDTNNYQKYYTKEQKNTFEEYLSTSLEHLKGEKDVLRKMFLETYAIPIKNYEKLNKV